MASLAEIRARLAAAENKTSGRAPDTDSVVYPHWNMDEGNSALLRFLPDGDSNNTFFWVERAMIKLPFAGVKGSMDQKQVMVHVPCVEMWGESCPILAEVRTWFKDPGLEDMGRKYWKKRSYIMQGFVRENPINDDKAPENPIRRFIMGPQIFTVIKSALMDPELEEIPTDYNQGLDFRVAKTSKGGYADYSTSKWARKETALTSDEQAAIDTHGLFNLSDFLPKRPDEASLSVMKEMFEASVDGQSYDLDRWGQYFRPVGMQPLPNATGQAAPAAPAAPAPTPEAAPAPVAETAPEPAPAAAEAPVETTQPSGKAEDILAMIRAKQAAQ